MAGIRGKIVNPITIGGNIVNEIETPVNVLITTNINYNASSLSTFLESGKSFFLPLNLSNVDNIFTLFTPEKYGQSIFRDKLTEKTITLFLSGNSSDNLLPVPIYPNNQIRYIDGGRTYQLLSSRSESNNFGWEPVSNRELYSHIERSDFDSFDFPQVTIRGVRKIPVNTGETLCGPITYTGYTYDRLNYNWLFGNNSGISFNPIEGGESPIPISGSMVSQEGVSSISNQKGELLFYTNGETVYTSGNTIMLSGTGLSSSGTSTQSSIIVPKPNSNTYYIFTTNYDGSSSGFEYSIVNMDLINGNGQVETKDITLINLPLTEKVTACNNSNDEDYWVITHTSGDSNYYVYSVTSSGLGGPIISNIGSVHNTSRGYMKTSPDGKKLISLLYDEDIIDILDFETSAGTLSNLITITGMTFNVGPYGLEFSSDSSKFYVSEGAGENIYQFDLSYTSATDMVNNVIEIANISGASLGALQMGPDERIYVADYGNTNLHIIHRPNGLGVLCNFEENGFTLTSSTITGTSSFWGLPNVITSKSYSCDRYVYISPVGKAGFSFEFIVNDINGVIDTNKLSYNGEIYKYNQNSGVFDTSSLYNFSLSYETLTASTKNDIFIPLANIGEGEFLIKSYWGYDVNTLLAKQQKIRKNSVDTYKRGILYGLYYPETDWYFINMFGSEKPAFNNSSAQPPNGTNNLTVASQFTVSGVTEYFMAGLSDPIVSYNGSILAKNIEYSAVTSGVTQFIQLLFSPLDNQILTYAYIQDGASSDLIADLYTVSSISSGATGTQSQNDRVFYNTTTGKYEFYLVSVPASDVLLSINGSTLVKDVEYYSSISNSRRIILEEPLISGDIIQAFYQPKASASGGIASNNLNVSWVIDSQPTSLNGKFTIEVTTPSDINFQNIVYTEIIDYVIGQRSYSKQLLLTNAVAGDKFIYRVKNEKFYTPIIGVTIYSVEYSDTVNIEILTNSGNSY
jgi:hypothetical protein